MPKQTPGVLAELRPPTALRSEPAAPVPAFTLTVPALAELMREAARQGAAEALAERQPGGAAARTARRSARDKTGAEIVGVQEMADRLGVSRSKMNESET